MWTEERGVLKNDSCAMDGHAPSLIENPGFNSMLKKNKVEN